MGISEQGLAGREAPEPKLDKRNQNMLPDLKPAGFLVLKGSLQKLQNKFLSNSIAGFWFLLLLLFYFIIIIFKSVRINILRWREQLVS